MIKLALLDMDGTLVDSIGIWRHASGDYIRKTGVDVGDEVDRIIFPMNVNDGVRYIRENILPDVPENEILTGIENTLVEKYRTVALKDGAYELLCRLAKMNIRLVLVSASTSNMVLPVIARLGIDGFFERVYTDANKAVDGTLARILDELSEKPSDTVILDDSLSALQMSKSIGIHTVGVYDSAWSDELDEMQKTCELTVFDFKDITAIADTITKI